MTKYLFEMMGPGATLELADQMADILHAAGYGRFIRNLGGGDYEITVDLEAEMAKRKWPGYLAKERAT